MDAPLEKIREKYLVLKWVWFSQRAMEKSQDGVSEFHFKKFNKQKKQGQIKLF